MRHFIISIYDELDIVKKSIENIRKAFPVSNIILIHSLNTRLLEDVLELKSMVNSYIPMQNLGNAIGLNKYQIPALSVMRNFSTGFSNLYMSGYVDFPVEYIVALTGDTLITDAYNFDRLFEKMKTNNLKLMGSQAIGQIFNGPNDDPSKSIGPSRIQDNNTTDFSCVFFIIDGMFAQQTKLFSNIDIVNLYCTEQCLGDEFLRCLNLENLKFDKSFGRLNNKIPGDCYSYNDGIIYHARTNGEPGDHRK